MGENFWKVWRDPVVSAVIAGIVVGAIPKITNPASAWWPTLTTSYPLPLWLTIVLSAVVAGSVMLSFRLHFRREAEFFPKIIKIDQRVSVADPNLKRNYPLKCFLQFRNDSPRCVEVRTGGYEADKVRVKNFVPSVLQVKLDAKWVPEQEVDRIAVMSGQIFRAWIGIDEMSFSEPVVKSLTGQLGTFSLMVEGNRIPFDL